jgi:hypothetical protein
MRVSREKVQVRVSREKVQAKQRRLAETNHLGSSRGEEEEEAGGGGEGREREARPGFSRLPRLAPLRYSCSVSLSSGGSLRTESQPGWRVYVNDRHRRNFFSIEDRLQQSQQKRMCVFCVCERYPLQQLAKPAGNTRLWHSLNPRANAFLRFSLLHSHISAPTYSMRALLPSI